MGFWGRRESGFDRLSGVWFGVGKRRRGSKRAVVEGGENLEREINGGDDGGADLGLEVREEFELGGALRLYSSFELLSHGSDAGHGLASSAFRLGLHCCWCWCYGFVVVFSVRATEI